MHRLISSPSSLEEDEAFANASLDWPLTHRTIATPAGTYDLATDDRLDVSGITIKSDAAPNAVASLNADLRKDLDRRRTSAFACDSNYRLPAFLHEHTTVALFTTSILSIKTREDLDCGGMYPQFDQIETLTYDLHTGSQIDWNALFPHTPQICAV